METYFGFVESVKNGSPILVSKDGKTCLAGPYQRSVPLDKDLEEGNILRDEPVSKEALVTEGDPVAFRLNTKKTKITCWQVRERRAAIRKNAAA